MAREKRRAGPATAIVLATASALALAGVAAAQQPAVDEIAQAQRVFDIPPQSLAGALAAFGQQSGMQVSVSAGLAQGVVSPGVSGSMTPVHALDRLLAGTGITYTLSGNTALLRSIATSPAGAMQLDPVQVQGNPVPPQAVIDNLPPPYAGGQVATGGQLGILGERGFMDTPFNQTNYTSKLIQDQQARSIADVVANDPSVRNTFPAASYTAPLYIRGFDVSNYEFTFNGLYNVGPAVFVSPEYLERVEVLKGPNVLLNGMPPFGGIGGAVNLVPKRAGNEDLNEATVTYASSAQFGGHFDFGRRFGDDKSIGFRFNGIYRNGNTPVDRQTQEVGAAVFGLDFRGERTRVSLDWGYQKQRYNSPLQFTYVDAGVPVPLAPGGSSNWFQPWTFIDTNELFGLAKAEFDVTPDWTLYAAIGGRDTRLNALRGGNNTVIDSSGALIQSVLYRPSVDVSNTEEVGVRGRVQTGPVNHGLTFSGSRLFMNRNSASVGLVTLQSNLYQPTFVNQPMLPSFDPPLVSSSELTSVAFADILSAVDERIQLILGLRLQRVQATNFGAGAVTSYFDQSALSPAFGLVVKPLTNVTIYGNYIQGLQQGPVAPAGAANADQVFPPTVSKQFEVGAKADFGRFATTLSAFQIDQPFGYTDPATNVFGVSGRQRNQGLEWTIFGEPLEGFRTLGGITLMNGRLLNMDSTLTSGMKAPGVPDVQLNLGAEWDTAFLRGLTFSGRVIHTSLQYVDPANTQSIPNWTRFDAGVRYTFERPDGKPVSLRFNVENLFDLNYWAAASPNFGLSMGAPRTFLVSLTAAF